MEDYIGMTHFSLFTGIGGLDIAAEWAGFETVGQVEWADYPTKILEKHWPTVPRWRDIKTVTKEDFYERTGMRTVDLISGGFPCQPFSTAGKRRGKEDDRYLWPEMLRIISDIRPRWVVGENVAGIINMALDQVLADLENQGYEAGAIVLPACGVNAPHRRYRVAILAHANGTGQQGWEQDAERSQKAPCDEFKPCGSDVADASRKQLERARAPRQQAWGGKFADSSWWDVEPDVGRVANGVPHRVDRIRCLGNAVVPMQFYPIFEAIAKMEAEG